MVRFCKRRPWKKGPCPINSKYMATRLFHLLKDGTRAFSRIQIDPICTSRQYLRYFIYPHNIKGIPLRNPPCSVFTGQLYVIKNYTKTINAILFSGQPRSIQRWTYPLLSLKPLCSSTNKSRKAWRLSLRLLHSSCGVLHSSLYHFFAYGPYKHGYSFSRVAASKERDEVVGTFSYWVCHSTISRTRDKCICPMLAINGNRDVMSSICMLDLVWGHW